MLSVNYNEIESKVRDATSDEPWGPNPNQLQDLAQLTFGSVDNYNQVLDNIWKRMSLSDKRSANWRRLDKSLLILLFLLKNGSEKVVNSIKEHLDELKSLETYSYMDENGKDAGVAVRHGIKRLLESMESDERLREERSDTLGSRKPADTLYKKGDHEAAIQEYIKTIGFLEPSYVILKYLDAQRIPFLTEYLIELHKVSVADSDHTTLLINCYAKLKDHIRLNEFIRGNLKFNVETAINTLRSLNYSQEALFLASRHKLYDHYFQIMIEDSKDAASALDYMKQNVESVSELANYLVTYGRFLVQQEPEKTTILAKDVLKILLTEDDLGGYSPSVSGPTEVNMDDFLKIFIKNSDEMLNFLEYAIQLKPEIISSTLYLTCMDLYLRSYATAKSDDVKRSVSSKVMSLLNTPNAHYDVPQAMVLCKLNNFHEGLLYLYQKSGHYQLILNHYIKLKDSQMMIKCCQDHGSSQPSLWIYALWFFAENPGTDSQIILILNEIERNKLLSPLMVISILSKNPKITITVLKDYFMRFLTRESQMITENERVIHQHKDETEKMRRSIEEMKSQPKVFQASKCSVCNQHLELPSVHFFCDHSYHLGCLESLTSDESGSDRRMAEVNECPICAPDNKNFLDLLKSRENNKDLHETFLEQLSKSDADVIAVISSFFSKGVFGNNDQHQFHQRQQKR